MDNKNKLKILLEKLGEKINANVLLTPVDIFYSTGKRKTNKRVYIKIPINERVIFGKFLINRNDRMVIKEADMLGKISTNQFLIPEVILKLNNGFFMSAVPGVPIEIILKKQGISKSMKILEKAVKLIANFHQVTEIKHIPLKKKLNIYLELTGKSSIDIKQKNLLKKVSVGYMHGDLDPFNMFFDTKTGNYGLIDWEDFTEKGFQELDILHFLIIIAVILYPNEDFISLYKKIFLKPTCLNKIIVEVLNQYCTFRGKGLHSVINFLPIYCDAQINRLVKTNRNPKDFLYESFKNLFQECGYKIYP